MDSNTHIDLEQNEVGKSSSGNSSESTFANAEIFPNEKTEKYEPTNIEHLLRQTQCAPAIKVSRQVPVGMVNSWRVEDEIMSPLDPSDDNLSEIITWDGPTDSSNPLNWPTSRKWAVVLIVSAFSFISSVSCSMVAPGLGVIAEEFAINGTVKPQFILSVYVLALGIGPLVSGPLSEMYGRVRVMQISNLIFLAFNLACGFAQNTGTMLVCRFISGLGGSAPLALGGGVIRDTWATKDLGKSIGIYSLAPLLGPAVGPLIGGFITDYSTWRWMFRSTTIADAAVQLVAFYYLHESYAPKLLEVKARKLRKDRGNPNLRTQWDIPDRTFAKTIQKNMVRPFILLGTQPIVQVMALYMAYLYGDMFLVFATFPQLWSNVYGESISIGGLNYLSMTFGLLFGSLTCGHLNDWIHEYLKKKYKGKTAPEYRVVLMVPTSLLVPAGFLFYGWTAHYHTHWILPNIGVFLFSSGTIYNFQCIQAYFLECYTIYAASAMAAAIVLRCTAGFGFPLFAAPMYNALGYGWGNTLLAFFAMAIGFPAPALLWKFGASVRARSAYAAG